MNCVSNRIIFILDLFFACIKVKVYFLFTSKKEKDSRLALNNAFLAAHCFVCPMFVFAALNALTTLMTIKDIITGL